MSDEVNQIVSFVFDSEAKLAQSSGYKPDDLWKVAYIKDTKTFKVLANTATGEFVSIGGTSGSGTTDILAFPYTSAGIQTAVDTIAASGNPGTVIFAPVDYATPTPVTWKSNISTFGLPEWKQPVGDIPDSDLQIVGGTRFINGSNNYAIVANHIPAADLPPSNFANNALIGCRFIGLSSVGGLGLMHIGSDNVIGAIKCHFEDLQYSDAQDWGIKLWNFQQCTFGNLTGRNSVPGGGIQYGFDIPHRTGDPGTAPLLLAGNSTWRDRTFIFNSHFATRGVELYVAPGSQLNQCNFEGGGQVNRFGGNAAGVDMTLIFENGSANVGFVNPAHYDLMVVGGAFQFKAGAVNWWEPTAVHYVVSKNDVNKTVQLSDWMYGTPRTASQTINTLVMTYGGHPGLAVCGSPTSIITNVKLGWWDLEISGNVTSLYTAGFRGSIDISEMYASVGARKATVTARASNLVINTTYPIGWIEATNNSTVEVNTVTANNEFRATGRTGANALTAMSHKGSTILNAATVQDFEVPPDMTYGFEYELTQQPGSAGAARFIAGSGVTLPALASTSGPGKTIKLKQTLTKNTYIITGDVA